MIAVMADLAVKPDLGRDHYDPLVADGRISAFVLARALGDLAARV